MFVFVVVVDVVDSLLCPAPVSSTRRRRFFMAAAFTDADNFDNHQLPAGVSYSSYMLSSLMVIDVAI